MGFERWTNGAQRCLTCDFPVVAPSKVSKRPKDPSPIVIGRWGGEMEDGPSVQEGLCISQWNLDENKGAAVAQVVDRPRHGYKALWFEIAPKDPPIGGWLIG